MLSFDNNYVQYRYMGTDITGNPNPFLDTSNWQGVDDEPTVGSDNLVKSGGVERGYITHTQEYTQAQKQTARANIGLTNIKEIETGNDRIDDIKIVDDENHRDLVHIYRTDAHVVNSFVINDDNDNEICRADKYGFHTRNLFYGANDTNIEDTIANLEERIDGNVSNNVVLIMFMGQSNMAGRGVVNAAHPQDAPQVIDGAGYEFRPISDPTKLYPITKTFGNTEDKVGGVNDNGRKTGGCVPAFVNSFYKTAKTTVIGVSASVGGTGIQSWQPNTAYLTDTISRLHDAIDFLEDNNYNILAKYVLWCQGEHDYSMSSVDYTNYFDTMSNALFAEGIEKMFILRIGKSNDPNINYDNVIITQNDLCKNNDNYIMATTVLASLKDKGLMKDGYHFFQEGYNIAGNFSGLHVGNYFLYSKSDVMYDVMTNSLFYDNKTY